MTDPAKLKLNVHNLFPTPIVRAEIPDALDINKALRPIIEARADSHSGTQHSNLGGWQSSWDFAEWGGAPATRIIAYACEVASRATSDRQGKPVTIDWQVNAWANVNEPGHANEFHTHPGSFWSGTYYVDDGYEDAANRRGGEFEMQDPRGVGPAMYAPLLAFNAPGGLSVGASEMTVPVTGHMLLFPSWLSHAVRPYEGSRKRISIAFNLGV